MTIKRMFKQVVIFGAGNAVVWAAMFYFTWGTFGAFEPGDILGLTRGIGFVVGIFSVGLWTIEN